MPQKIAEAHGAYQPQLPSSAVLEKEVYAAERKIVVPLLRPLASRIGRQDTTLPTNATNETIFYNLEFGKKRFPVRKDGGKIMHIDTSDATSTIGEADPCELPCDAKQRKNTEHILPMQTKPPVTAQHDDDA